MATSTSEPHEASTDGVSLLSGEVVHANVYPSWGLWKWHLALGAVAVVVGIAIGEPWSYIGGLVIGYATLVYVYISRRRNRYVVTDLRIIERSGFVRKSTREVRIAELRNITTSTSLLGRLLGYGRIEIDGPKAGPDIVMEAVSDYDAIATTIREQRYGLG